MKIKEREDSSKNNQLNNVPVSYKICFLIILEVKKWNKKNIHAFTYPCVHNIHSI